MNFEKNQLKKYFDITIFIILLVKISINFILNLLFPIPISIIVEIFTTLGGVAAIIFYWYKDKNYKFLYLFYFIIFTLLLKTIQERIIPIIFILNSLSFNPIIQHLINSFLITVEIPIIYQYFKKKSYLASKE